MSKKDFIEDEEIDLEPFKKELQDIETIQDEDREIIESAQKNELQVDSENEILKQYNIDENSLIQYEDLKNRRMVANKMIIGIIIAILLIFTGLFSGIILGLNNFLDVNRKIYVPVNPNTGNVSTHTINNSFTQFNTNVGTHPKYALSFDLGAAASASLGNLSIYQYFRCNFEFKMLLSDKNIIKEATAIVNINQTLTTNINLLELLPTYDSADSTFRVKSNIIQWIGQKPDSPSIYHLGFAIYNSQLNGDKNNHNYLLIYIYSSSQDAFVSKFETNNINIIFWTSN